MEAAKGGSAIVTLVGEAGIRMEEDPSPAHPTETEAMG